MIPTQTVQRLAQTHGAAQPTCPPSRRAARVYVVETAHRGWFAMQYGAALSYLGVDLHQGDDVDEVPAWLAATRPMAVVSLTTRIGHVRALLDAVAAHDPGLPTLLLAPGSFAGVVDAARHAMRLRALRHQPGDPGMHAVIDFSFAAGCRHGCVQFMPA